MALLQLIAGSPPTYSYMTGNTPTPECANLRASVMHWFVAREDGLARAEDVVHAADAAVAPWRVLGHQRDRDPREFQPSMRPAVQHAAGLSLPFDVRKERMAARIQAAWRRAITCPRYSLCRARLLREFAELRGS